MQDYTFNIVLSETYIYVSLTHKSDCWFFFLVRSESKSQSRPTAFPTSLHQSARRPPQWSLSSMLAHCGSTACLRVPGRQGPAYVWPRCACWTAEQAAGRVVGQGRPLLTHHPPRLPQRSRMMGKRRRRNQTMKFKAQSWRALRYPLQHHASSRGPFSCS